MSGHISILYFLIHFIISHLNSYLNENLENYYALSGGTAIPANADLNEYRTPGNYYCNSNAIAETLSNCPTKKAFILKVELGSGTQYPSQSIVELISRRKMSRIFVSSWEPWAYTSLMSDTWFSPPAFNATSYSSLDTAARAYIDSLPNSINTMYFGSIDMGSRYAIIVQKYNSSDYASGILFGYSLTRPKYYQKAAGTWRDAVEL